MRQRAPSRGWGGLWIELCIALHGFGFCPSGLTHDDAIHARSMRRAADGLAGGSGRSLLFQAARPQHVTRVQPARTHSLLCATCPSAWTRIGGQLPTYLLR